MYVDIFGNIYLIKGEVALFYYTFNTEYRRHLIQLHFNMYSYIKMNIKDTCTVLPVLLTNTNGFAISS